MKVLLTFLLVGTLILAACTAQSQSSQTNTPSANQPGSVNAQSPTGNAASASNAIKALFSKRSSMQWKIAYNLTIATHGSNTQSNMIERFKGPSQMRIDMSVMGRNISTYMQGKVFTTCTQFAGSWNCVNADTSRLSTAEQVEQQIQNDSSLFKITDDGTTTVIGIPVNCYSIKDVAGTIDVRECFGSDGVPLLITENNTRAMTTMIATSYDKQVSDADFVLPATPTASVVPGANPGAGQMCAACNYLSGDSKTACLQRCGSAAS